ncbi:hypothetical protein CLG96_15545 [Sphingomonas oleivorans]|uniref:Protein ImuA n=1 Tax=Sphingomonas oleivorans TaxID=1735121 RepID=A0A2T5FV35_9SPHN|nr:hypothetical protein [Sphingomonas oleivorans]PTQ08601.1 hypothetical protein CLG96_15545 [Sphingomonas oleivorans]
MPESSPSFAALKRQFAMSEPCSDARGRFALGCPTIDTALGGGLARGRLHEVFAAQEEDGASTAGFALMLALRACDAGETIFWIRQEAGARIAGRIHAPGLAELGADPRRILFADTPDEAATLRAAADALRSPVIGAVLIAPWGKAPMLDLTASRRLTLAAEQSGVTAILLRGAVEPPPSAATSRWRVSAAPSIPLEADAPGHPAFMVDLLRHRSGLSASGWRLEWDRDRLAFRAPPLSVALAPLAAERRADAERRFG